MMHDEAVLCGTFSRDGEHLATGSTASTIDVSLSSTIFDCDAHLGAHPSTMAGSAPPNERRSRRAAMKHCIGSGLRRGGWSARAGCASRSALFCLSSMPTRVTDCPKQVPKGGLDACSPSWYPRRCRDCLAFFPVLPPYCTMVYVPVKTLPGRATDTASSDTTPTPPLCSSGVWRGQRSRGFGVPEGCGSFRVPVTYLALPPARLPVRAALPALC